ncbi:MAG: methylated-DNA--[protein]-cysteine S-methyltransferase [Candidatus Eiseniibacteriota bacterium]
MEIRIATMDSPVGPLALAWRGESVVAVHMEEAKDRRAWETKYVAIRPLARLEQHVRRRFPEAALVTSGDGAPLDALRRYFEGDVHAIDDLPVDPGGQPFHAKVWRRLREIPAGETLTYGEIAAEAGRPGAARAAGGAVGGNPIPIIIPCHRVVGSDRSLTGFGGGIARKRWLLEHEGALERSLI